MRFTPVTNPIFPITFSLPRGWKVLKGQDNNTVLVPSTPGEVEALLIAHMGLYAKTEPLIKGIAASLKDLNCKNIEVREEGERTLAGKKLYVAKGQALNGQDKPVVFSLYSLLSGKQLGVGLLTLSQPAQGNETLRAAEELMTSLQFGSFAPSKAAAAPLMGVWESGRSEGSRTSGVGGVNISSFTRYVFQGSGRFALRSQSSMSASGEFGDFGSSLAKDSSTEDEGEFFVVGKKLVLSSAKNGTTVTEFTLQGGVLKLNGATLRRK